jgi:hypothetical protein
VPHAADIVFPVTAVLSGLCLLIGFAWVCCLVATVLKGKWLSALLLMLPTLGLIVFGTGIRLAKPASWWARRYYDREKLRQAYERFEFDPEQARRQWRAAPRN